MRPPTHSDSMGPTDYPSANGLQYPPPLSSPTPSDSGLSLGGPSSQPGTTERVSGNLISPHSGKRPPSGQQRAASGMGLGSIMGPPPDQHPGNGSPVFGRGTPRSAGKMSRLSSASFLPKPAPGSDGGLQSPDLPVASLRMPTDFGSGLPNPNITPSHLLGHQLLILWQAWLQLNVCSPQGDNALRLP